jgi:hypothetical protein
MPGLPPAHGQPSQMPGGQRSVATVRVIDHEMLHRANARTRTHAMGYVVGPCGVGSPHTSKMTSMEPDGVGTSSKRNLQ